MTFTFTSTPPPWLTPFTAPSGPEPMGQLNGPTTEVADPEELPPRTARRDRASVPRLPRDAHADRPRTRILPLREVRGAERTPAHSGHVTAGDSQSTTVSGGLPSRDGYNRASRRPRLNPTRIPSNSRNGPGSNTPRTPESRGRRSPRSTAPARAPRGGSGRPPSRPSGSDPTPRVSGYAGSPRPCCSIPRPRPLVSGVVHLNLLAGFSVNGH